MIICIVIPVDINKLWSRFHLMGNGAEGSENSWIAAYSRLLGRFEHFQKRSFLSNHKYGLYPAIEIAGISPVTILNITIMPDIP